MGVLGWVVYAGLKVLDVLLNAFISSVGLLNILLHLPGSLTRALLHFLVNVVLKHWHVYRFRCIVWLRRSHSQVGEPEQDDEGVKRFGMGG